MSNTNTIIPKDCSYGCNTRIYWNTATSEYWEVFTKKKHICPNRSTQSKPTVSTSSSTTTRPNYYNKFAKQPKPKMSNSLELLTGSIDSVKKQYEILSDIVSDLGGKCHGSQSHIIQNNSISLIVYFEVIEGRLNDFKEKFNNQIVYYTRQQNYR